MAKIDVSTIEGYDAMTSEEKIAALTDFDFDDRAAEHSNELEELRTQIEELKKERLIASHKAEFLSLGYDDSLASETAKALAEGDTAVVFANQKKFLESHDQSYKAELLRGTPEPSGGQGGEVMTLETLRKMSPAERHKFFSEHPEEYKKIYGGK